MLAPYGDEARSHPRGIVDLSVGTPVDDTPEFIQDALREASNSPGYPLTMGTPELRAGIREWATSHLGASGEFDVLPTIGSKELVAWLPTFLESKRVLFPEIAYPTYKVGALLSNSAAMPVGEKPDSWPEGDLAWVNSPSNPTGRTHSESEFDAVISWARKNNSIVACDECYLEFGDAVNPISILSRTGGDNKNILAVHSLSKRSNLAGYRAAFIVGDSELINRIREIRKHAGMMVSLPVQRAMEMALKDDVHVNAQRARYIWRRSKLVTALSALGFSSEKTDAGLYIWTSRGERDMETVSWFARRGILVTPGHFYGEKGSGHIRIALTASDAQIEEAVSRLEGAQ